MRFDSTGAAAAAGSVRSARTLALNACPVVEPACAAAATRSRCVRMLSGWWLCGTVSCTET
jgi:hypothetical protein